MNFGFLKRGRKAEALKFDFELRAMEIAHESIAGKLVCVRWSRGSKKTGVSKNVVSSSDGRAIWAHDEPLKLTVTLYRSKPTSIFDSKEIKLSLEEVVKVGKTKILGRGSAGPRRVPAPPLFPHAHRPVRPPPASWPRAQSPFRSLPPHTRLRLSWRRRPLAARAGRAERR